MTLTKIRRIFPGSAIMATLALTPVLAETVWNCDGQTSDPCTTYAQFDGCGNNICQFCFDMNGMSGSCNYAEYSTSGNGHCFQQPLEN